MAKNKNDSSIVIAIIIVLALVISLNLNWANPLTDKLSSSSNSQFSEKEKAETSLGENLATGGASSTLNLCGVITPYVSEFNLQSLCNLNGGTWICSAKDIECSNMLLPLIDCNLDVVKTAVSQCQAAGATAFCDSKTLSCKY